jgi:hypothetical protein
MQGDGRRLVLSFAQFPHPNIPGNTPSTPRAPVPGSALWRTSAFDQLL